jgi:hypothetical protein
MEARMEGFQVVTAVGAKQRKKAEKRTKRAH